MVIPLTKYGTGVKKLVSVAQKCAAPAPATVFGLAA